jgi:hypothetical protein
MSEPKAGAAQEDFDELALHLAVKAGLITEDVLARNVKHCEKVVQFSRDLRAEWERDGEFQRVPNALLGDKDEYCEVLRVLGMEEEGSAVTEILRLIEVDRAAKKYANIRSRSNGDALVAAVRALAKDEPDPWGAMGKTTGGWIGQP